MAPSRRYRILLMAHFDFDHSLPKCKVESMDDQAKIGAVART
jgi:hypothetical protein